MSTYFRGSVPLVLRARDSCGSNRKEHKGEDDCSRGELKQREREAKGERFERKVHAMKRKIGYLSDELADTIKGRDVIRTFQ